MAAKTQPAKKPAPKKAKPNTGELAGIECPQCGHRNPFRVYVPAWFTLWDDGIEDFDDWALTDKVKIECPACKSSGTVADFRGGVPSKKKAPSSDPIPSGCFTIDTAALVPALGVLSGLAPRLKGSALAGVRLVSLGNGAGGVEVRALDTRCEIPLAVQGESADVLVDCHALAKAVTKRRKGRAVFQVRPDTRSGSARLENKTNQVLCVEVPGKPPTLLPLMDRTHWPEAFEHGGTKDGGCHTGSAVFLGALRYTQRTMSADETRYNLMGVFVDGKNRLVSSDGHRLHRAPYEGKLPAEKIIPDTGVRAICAAFDGDVPLLTRPWENGAHEYLIVEGPFKASPGHTVQITTKFVNAKFPDADAVVPKDGVLVSLDGPALRRSLATLMPYTTNANNLIQLTIDTHSIELAAENETHGALKDIVGATAAGGKWPLTIGVNAQYLLEAIEPTWGTVALTLQDNSAAAIRIDRGTDAANEQRTAIVMPIDPSKLTPVPKHEERSEA